MDPVRVPAILNGLLDAEHRALLPRPLEAKAFVTADRVADLEAVRRMVAQRDQDVARLAETVGRFGGEPGPRSADIASASFHYVELPVLLPRVIADQEALCRRYEQAVEVLADSADAAQVVADIAARHRVHLEYLRQLAADIVPGS